MRPIIRNCERFYHMINIRPKVSDGTHTSNAAARPEKNKAMIVSLGTVDGSGTVSKNGATNANSSTEMGAWFSNSWGLDTPKSLIFFPIHTW